MKHPTSVELSMPRGRPVRAEVVNPKTAPGTKRTGQALLFMREEWHTMGRRVA